MNLDMGRYSTDSDWVSMFGWPYAKTKSNYIKVVTGIYLPHIKGYGKPYVGVILKTHTAIADYLAIMGGISF